MGIFGRQLLGGMLRIVAPCDALYPSPKGSVGLLLYFLNWAVSRKGNLAKDVHKPGDAAGYCRCRDK